MVYSAPTYFAPTYFAPAMFAGAVGNYFAPSYFAADYHTPAYWNNGQGLPTGTAGSRTAGGGPGCCACSEPPCCFRVVARACDNPFPGVTITLKLSGVTVLTGTTDSLGRVVSGGTVQQRCTNAAETYDVTWTYAGASGRITTGNTVSFDGSAPCPGGVRDLTLTFSSD